MPKGLRPPEIKGKNDSYFATVKYFYRQYKYEKRHQSVSIVSNAKHALILSLFHKHLLGIMCSKLYIFKIPFGIGAICIGEEAAIRKYIRELYTDENGKTQCRLTLNTGLKKCFRVCWRKLSCNIENKFGYYIKPIEKTRKAIANYINSRDQDLMKPNFRAHTIINYS